MRGGETVQSTTVEGNEEGSVPASMTKSMNSAFSPNCARIFSTVFSVGMPLIFALVAVMGLPKVRASERENG